MLQKGVGKICCVIPVVAAQRRSKRKVESGAAVPSCDLWMTPLLLVERVAFRTFPLAGKHFPGTFYWLDFAKLFSSQDQGHYYYEIFWAWSPALAWPFTALFCPFLSYSFYRWIWRQNPFDSVSILGVANGKIREKRKTAFAALRSNMGFLWLWSCSIICWCSVFVSKAALFCPILSLKSNSLYIL